MTTFCKQKYDNSVWNQLSHLITAINFTPSVQNSSNYLCLCTPLKILLVASSFSTHFSKAFVIFFACNFRFYLSHPSCCCFFTASFSTIPALFLEAPCCTASGKAHRYPRHCTYYLLVLYDSCKTQMWYAGTQGMIAHKSLFYSYKSTNPTYNLYVILLTNPSKRPYPISQNEMVVFSSFQCEVFSKRKKLL